MTSYALLIGCWLFPRDARLRQLRGPRIDVHLISQALCHPDSGVFEPPNVTVLLNPDSTEARRAVSALFECVTAADTALLYYSGHGMTLPKSIERRLFLTTRDTVVGDLPGTSLPGSFINDVMAAHAPPRTLVLLDCCKSGEFNRDGLLDDDRYILGATTVGFAADGSDDGALEEPSPFTEIFARALLGDGLITDPHGVTVDDLYPVLRRELEARKLPPPYRRAGNGPPAVVRRPNRTSGYAAAVEAARSHEGSLIAARLARLPEQIREACRDMLVLPDGITVSERLVTAWWAAAAGRALHEPERLVDELALESVIAMTPPEGSGHGRRIELHPYARLALSAGLTHERRESAHRSLVESARALLLRPDEPEAWWTLPPTMDDLWGNLPFHLRAAGLADEAGRLVCDLRWVAATISRFGSVTRAQSDLQYGPAPVAPALRTALGRARHVIDAVAGTPALATTLLSRIPPSPALRQLRMNYETSLPRPRLLLIWPPPDEPHPAQRLVISDFDGPVRAVAVGPQDAWLTAIDNAGVGLWQPHTGELIDRFGADGGDPLRCCAVVRGGSRIVAGDGKGIRVFLTARGSGELDVQRHRSRPVRACAVSPNGEWILTTGTDNIARRSAVAEQATPLELLGHRGVVNCCAMSEEWMATGSSDGTVRIWNADATTRHHPLDGDGSAFLCCAFSADGALLAAGTARGNVFVWRVQDGGQVRRYPAHRGTRVRCCVFAPDGSWIATGGDDGEVVVWRWGKSESTLQGHRRPVGSIAVASDGSWLVSAGDDGTVRVWRPEEAAMPVLPRRADPARFCVVTDHGKGFVTGGSGVPVRRWRRDAPDHPVRVYEQPAITATAGPDDRILATGYADGTVRLWEGDRCVRSLPGSGVPVTVCAFAPDASWLAAGHQDGSVKVSALRTGVELHESRIAGGPVRGMHAPSAERLVCVAQDGTFWHLRPTAATAPDQAVGRVTTTVRSGTFSADGRWYYAACADGTAQKAAVDREVTLFRIAHDGAVTGCAPNSGGTLVATVGSDRMLRIWDGELTDPPLAAIRVALPLSGCGWLADDALVAVGDGGSYLLTYEPLPR